ncbi:isoleucine--tRNA ligase [Allomuricauda sp.]|jgi:isoleucyl-tRNA synthetase|uniref:isoleucine--tRNA ligase n=1 Tax=Flagellimonas sp. TaxID=2058762 RepID=UPI001B26DBA5|nr:isoleucine--tRNA ligase [Allomuricauda sp.]MBO6587815.1 isoleucine--tRNA ligase [Allomuricauda sp.]MBO6617440.1 isoleucine--tRNA ligase [Allomuricauda sp.]MBO6643549.1 isoleucine--tRNA ligase [Allomuricauda sp.]MBO6745775.1 isoleucine--tRNA ligase [Allomuricauda sp.]MBO6828084.1 isoleucine--tRNA ligase [Allomuricauda sp.]
MKFAEYKGLDLPKISEDILDFWEDKKIFEKSVSSREGKESYVFFEGPPSANGMPGIHHVMARTIKDIFPRYKTMKGFQVKRKAGWDTHGLPVEIGVEKELGITKEDIGTKISVEDYNAACKKAVMRYTDVWNEMTEKVGYWVDMDDPYITYKSKYMESVWWLLKQIYDKGLIYKGYTIQPYSPKAGTGLSSHELNQPGTYQDVTDTTVTAQFKAKTDSLPDFLKKVEGDIYLLAWTTTPWTLPSNTALTVGPKIEYVLVRSYNQYTFEPINVVLAKNLVNYNFSGKFTQVETEEELKSFQESDKKIPYLVGEAFVGKDLVGIQYEQLIDYVQPYQNPENAFRVISGDFVTTEDGTGIVHTAPTFGADDALVAKQATPEVPPMLVLDENANPVPLVDLQGKFRPELREFGGKYVKNEYYDEGEAPEKSVDVEIAIKLKTENKAFKVEKYVHSYPNCWRTDKPILYYPLNSWFIKVTDVKDRMFELNQSINWKPKSTGEGRFGNWLANANDWNLSRSRYWGIPLPIWRTEDGKEELIVGSVEELKSEMAKAVEAGVMDKDVFEDFVVGDMSEENYDKIDLHKNIVDGITLVSPSGQPMKREADLIDVWFDSGSMPYAQWHYPFENRELIDDGVAFPANFIAEGVDQTRGWFYTLHAIATMVFDSIAYKNVVSNGLVLDKEGKKMSKRLGNAVDPFEVLPEHGPDATRWYMISNANPWDNLKFDIEGVVEVKRKFFGTLYNTYSFMALYANIDEFDYSEPDVPLTERPEIDQWILSELHTLIKNVDEAYGDYEATRAARMISDYVQENLSNWYVRLSRRRFWKGDYQTDKISAYQTLYTCLTTVAKLSAPIAPFFMDQLYRDLDATTQKEGFESVHLAEFPVFDAKMVNKDLERKMQLAQKISSLVLSIRQKEKIKVRQPLQKIMIPVLDEEQRRDIEAVSNLVKSEVNVKEIAMLDDASGVLVKQIKPNFKVLGPKFGKDMKAIAAQVSALGQEDIQKMEREGELMLQLENKTVNLQLTDVEISSQDIEGWLVASSGPLTVALDVTIDETLKKEGIARELVNRIQNLRKESGFEVTDKIDIKILKDGLVENAVSSNVDYIKTETLTAELNFEEKLEEGVAIAFDEVNTKLFIQKH